MVKVVPCSLYVLHDPWRCHTVARRVVVTRAFLPFHPFDLLYNYGVRHFTGTRPFPHNGPQRKFACGLAFAWLIATGWAFYMGASTLGFALGVPLILVAALVSTTHICIPSIIYNFLFRKQGPGSV